MGVAINYTDQNQRAALWYGTPESFVDLTPPGFEGGQGQAYGVAGGQQVGGAATRQTGGTRAMLWFGSAESYVDLGSGVAQDTNGRQQVGWIPTVGFDNHAAVWSGTPQSRLDLHQFLPPQFQGQGAFSRAYAIDAEGNIIGYAEDLQDVHHGKAVMWSPVPEPGTVATLATLPAARRRAKRG